MSSFVHLHVHTEYSLLDGAARVEALVGKAKSLGMKAIAITDHGNMYGVIPFYKACKKAGIKPIIGCEVYITSGSRHDRVSRQEQKIFHLVLLAKNNTGYQNLMKIVSIGHLEGFYYKPRIDKEVLNKYKEGIIALSGCLSGEINYYSLQNNLELAKKTAIEYKEIFGEDFYLELQDHQLPEQQKINPLLVRLSKETNIPLVVTNDVHYVEKEDAVIQDILLAIGTGTTVDDKQRLRFNSSEFYLKSEGEMLELFQDRKAAYHETVKIADKCNLDIDLNQHALPKFPLLENVTADGYLQALATKGLEKRYGQVTPQLKERLEYELAVIRKMGFADYFLIVWDFMKFAHQKEIMTGPGRGSAAGSLVAYVLGITSVDPIKYGLLFERFLNPERVNMPDIDIDFNYERRDEVIKYVSEKYSSNHVAQIITFGTFAARAAIRDVGRVLNLPYNKVDRLAKLIPSQLGITIKQALNEVEELRRLYKENDDMQKLINIAIKIEGMPRHHSTHAAGVVISDKALTAYTPLQIGQEDISLTQYTMGILEEIGLLKMDFLGLRNLTIIEKALKWIEKTQNRKITFTEIDDSDQRTYQLLSSGHTKGVFQLESPGMIKVLKELKPSNFEDIVAVLALYRPGPMEFIPDYIKAKHGQRQIMYPHDSLKAILADTYGIIIYQEQIMQIASKMAGFSLGEADLLRRAVGKKKRELLIEQREHFVKGSLANHYSEETANEVYDLIVRFADYGFNRSHAVAYGVLAFQTAFLKANYPVEFMTALISESMGNPEKVVEYIEESKKMGIEVLPPDILVSDYSFTNENGKLRFGFAAIKNIGNQIIEAILKVRQDSKEIKTVIDFCMKVDQKVCNRKTMEALILSGAFDSFEIHRAKLLANLDDFLDRIQKKRKLQDDLQIHMFEDINFHSETEFEWIEIPPFSEKEKLRREKEVLGLYLSGHPLKTYQKVLQRYQSHAEEELSLLKDGTKVAIGGLIRDIKVILTKKGQQMAFVKLETKANEVELILFPRAYEVYHNLLVQDQAVFIQGKSNNTEENIKIIVDKLILLEDIILRSGNNETKLQSIVIKISVANQQNKILSNLKEILLLNKGNIPVILAYESNNRKMKLSEKYWVNKNQGLKRSIEKLLGDNTYYEV